MKRFFWLAATALQFAAVVTADGAEYGPRARGRAFSVDFIGEDLHRFFGREGGPPTLLRLRRTQRVSRLVLYAAENLDPRESKELQPRRVDGLPTRRRLRPTRLIASILLAPTAPRAGIYRIREVASFDSRVDRLVFAAGGTVDFEIARRSVVDVIEVRGPGASAPPVRLRYVEVQYPLFDECSRRLDEEST